MLQAGRPTAVEHLHDTLRSAPGIVLGSSVERPLQQGQNAHAPRAPARTSAPVCAEERTAAAVDRLAPLFRAMGRDWQQGGRAG